MYRLLAALMVFVATSTFADEVRMAFGEKIPPFCFPETNSGIEIEVIAEALAVGGGHRLKPVYYPFARVPVAFKAGEVDAAMTDLGEDMQPHGGHYGDPAVFYDNVFITLRSRGLQIRRPEDLKGLSVIAFQGADKRYPEWLGPVKQAGNYHEQNDQSLQVRMLNDGRHDVVLSDRSIFRYFPCNSPAAAVSRHSRCRSTCLPSRARRTTARCSEARGCATISTPASRR